jgi:hypothetical protein
MRSKATGKFIDFISELETDPARVAILGGTSQDPEAEYLIQNYQKIELHFFNIENTNSDSNYHHLDINSDKEINVFRGYFDLIISCHVIEHIWNHQNFFDLFSKLSCPNAAIWVNCPTSNIVHGSPDYFSAGFTAKYLKLNLQERGFQSVKEGQFGNKRNYFGAHIFGYWLSPAENRHPLLQYNFQTGTFQGIVKKFIIDLPSRIFLEFQSNEESPNSRFHTESYLGAIKKF